MLFYEYAGFYNDLPDAVKPDLEKTIKNYPGTSYVEEAGKLLKK